MKRPALPPSSGKLEGDKGKKKKKVEVLPVGRSHTALSPPAMFGWYLAEATLKLPSANLFPTYFHMHL